MANIGLSYFHGNGVPRDLTLAMTWIKKCALADEPKGMVMVGEAVRQRLFKREYRDHRLEWMIRSGGLDVVLVVRERQVTDESAADEDE